MLRLRAALLCAVLVFGHFAVSQATGQSSSSTASQQRPTSTPYTGDLSVFDSPGRDQRLQIERVMDILGITSGKAVADIGAGSGWFTVRAAKRVGGEGTVYAVDINPEAARYIEARAKQDNMRNVKTIVNHPDDPGLPANSVDAVLFLKAYHEIAEPIQFLKNLRPALHPNARIGIIDRNGDADNHGVNKDIVIREAKESGYALLHAYDFVKGDKMDYFLVFTAAQ